MLTPYRDRYRLLGKSEGVQDREDELRSGKAKGNAGTIQVSRETRTALGVDCRGGRQTFSLPGLGALCGAAAAPRGCD
jgi:hypothetical protein